MVPVTRNLPDEGSCGDSVLSSVLTRYFLRVGERGGSFGTAEINVGAGLSGAERAPQRNYRNRRTYGERTERERY